MVIEFATITNTDETNIAIYYLTICNFNLNVIHF